MTTFGKSIYITFIIVVFLLSTGWDYFKNGHWALLENLFYSLWVASFLFLTSFILRNKKNDTKNQS
ncbi:RNA polymerase subunit sigma [Lysinibacillus sp. F5]|uniref:RNA polymerase subunit sigma n=1 Tax=Lysinibacillus fusiformis TaxID=28031 RepID=A0A2I0V072_9BACI|nr:RNA polymerase subunit sigma [Lysinibacillus sp. F5]PKU51656.1 RNA polymerase subunit sigma [Lysinibacillus fusiformis]